MINFDASELLKVVNGTVDDIRESLNESALRKVGVAGAAVFRDEAKQNALAHAKTRTIYRNIIIKHIDEQSNAGKFQVYKVTVRKGRYSGDDAFYWRWVEDGHKVVRRKPKGKTWKAHRAAQVLEFGSARVPAYPFMRPAYESKKKAAIDAMTRTLAEQLQRNAHHGD